MNNSQTDGAQDTESASVCLSTITEEGTTDPAAEVALADPAAEEGMTYAAIGPDAEAPPARSRTGVTRGLVIVAISLASVAMVLCGASWLLYRAGHTVISHATVRGRVHRVGARIDGQVKSVEVQPNQRVSKGDVLIHLEAEHLQAALREAQSEFEAASKRYDADKLSIEFDRRRLPLEVERSESNYRAVAAEVEAAASNQEKLEREYDRVHSLIKAGISSVSEMDRVQGERDNARALVRAAQGKLAAAESDCRVARVQLEGLRVREAGSSVLAAEMERTRQHVSSVQADLDATVIRAPADGWVAERIVEPGGSARVGEPMLSLWIGAPWIEAWADEKNLAGISVGSPVDVTFTAFPGRKLQGRVEAIGVLADKELHPGLVPSTLHSLFPENAMVPINVSVSADELRLQPGLSALVGIQDPTRNSTIKLAGWFDNMIASILRSSSTSNK
jgi:membrane fusion protein, multidrug efflux system